MTALVMAVTISACGGGGQTSAPATQGPAATASGTGGGGGGTGVGPEDLPATLIAPAFGGTAPTPQCGDMAPSGDFCRWATADESIVLDIQRDGQYGTEEAWRAAFGNAGFSEEIGDLGVPVLGGTTALSPGFRAAAYGTDHTSYSVSLTSDGDPATVKATVLAILRVFAGA